MVHITMGMGSRCSRVYHHFSGPFTRQFLNLQHRVKNYRNKRNLARIALQAGVKPACILLFKRCSFRSLSELIVEGRKVSHRKIVYKWPALYTHMIQRIDNWIESFQFVGEFVFERVSPEITFFSSPISTCMLTFLWRPTLKWSFSSIIQRLPCLV